MYPISLKIFKSQKNFKKVFCIKQRKYEFIHFLKVFFINIFTSFYLQFYLLSSIRIKIPFTQFLDIKKSEHFENNDGL